MSTTDYSLVKQELARFIGTPEEKWSSKVSTDVESCIRMGIEAVIRNGVHEWLFMRPRWTWTTSDGQRRYTLPVDFEQFIDNISFDGEYFGYPDIVQKPPTQLHQMFNQCESTGTPKFYALEALSHDGTSQQQMQLVLQPTPNGSYPLAAIYQVGPIRDLTGEHPYFPGGPAHRELFIASCLACAELRFRGMKGEANDHFQSLLAAAISLDHRRQARNLGQLSGRRGRRFRRRDLVDGYTTYNGGTEL